MLIFMQQSGARAVELTLNGINHMIDNIEGQIVM